MKDSLKAGIKFDQKYVVPISKTVLALNPESEEFVVMPEVFATRFFDEIFGVCVNFRYSRI
jgi:fluoroacetyl-CoA thioesterase